MSDFAVDIREIEEVREHTNADSLELVKLNDLGFQIVVRKGQHKVGDKVVYFPVDSVLQDETIEQMGLTGRLAGSKKNRVKTIKLRGEISQGLVDWAGGFFCSDFPVGTDVTDLLGVVKYAPSEIITPTGVLNPLPDGVSKYDIDSLDRYGEAYNHLISIPHAATEKLEGTNFSCTINEEGEVFVCSRSHTIEENANNLYWQAAKQQCIPDVIRAMHHINQNITLYGELVGPAVQKNHYELTTRRIYFFDIKLNFEFVGVELFYALMNEFLSNFHTPILDTLDPHGQSTLNPKKLREGIVIKPLVEQTYPGLGRLILKKRDGEYLLKTGN